MERTQLTVTAKDDGFCTAPHVCEYSITFYLTFQPRFRMYTNYSDVNDVFTDCDGIEIYSEFPKITTTATSGKTVLPTSPCSTTFCSCRTSTFPRAALGRKATRGSR